MMKLTKTAEAALSAPARARKGRGRPRLNEVGLLDGELLAHALDHFLEKGFEATTVSAITRSLGMSKQTVYSRYPDKSSLFFAAIKSATDVWLAPVASMPEQECEDIEATLVGVAAIIVTTMMSDVALRLIRITNAESYRMPEIGRFTYGRGHQLIADYLRDLFQRRIMPNTGPGTDLEDLVTAFLNLMSGPARLNAWGLEVEPVNVDVFVNRRVHLFLRGALEQET